MPVLSRFVVAALLLAIALAAPAGADAPSASAVLGEVGFSAEDTRAALAGELVTTNLESTSDRELAVAMSFLVRGSTEGLVESFHDGLTYRLDEGVTASGGIDGDGSLADFEALRLEPGGARVADRLRRARPGNDWNLSGEERARLGALDSEGLAGVERVMREILLARYRSYRADGLAGIPPYDRGRRAFEPAEDLRRATEASVVLRRYAPALHRTLLEYPRYRPDGFRERFLWLNFEIDGLPTFVLSHRMSVELAGGVHALAQRHYFVGRSHNTVQVVGAMSPVEEGTLVVYANRTSTDQVVGFGSSARHAIGRRMMSSQIGALFGKLKRKKAGVAD